MIATARLLIRPFRTAEAAEFFELSCDEGFRLHPITDYRQADVQAAASWIATASKLNQESGLGKWGVWGPDEADLLGMGGLTPWEFEGERMVDVTYRLRTSAWGKGLGLELAQALVRWGFERHRLPEITATITPDNEASRRIAQRLGMRFDRRITLLGTATDLFRLAAQR